MAQGAFQLTLQPILDCADAIAGFGESGAGVVGDFAAFVDGGFDLVNYGGEVGDALGDPG